MVFAVGFLSNFWFGFFFLGAFGLGNILLPDFGFDFGVGACNFLLLAVGSDGAGVEDTALVEVLHDFLVLLALGHQLLEGHDGVVVHAYYKTVSSAKTINLHS